MTHKVPKAAKKSSPRHYSVEWDTDESYTPMTVDARSLTLPSIAIIGVVMAFVWGTFLIVSERNRLDTRISNVITAVEKLADSVERLANESTIKSYEKYTRADHDFWCIKAEQMNKGWSCPPLPPPNGSLSSAQTNAVRDSILSSLKDRDKELSK